jgi:hypothetical protein
MSWSVKITVLYLGFVGIILTLVFTCFAHKTELEFKDYYARELNFQGQIDATANADNLSKPIEYVIRDRSVQIILPKEVLSSNLAGSIHFLRPSDATKDKLLKLTPGSDGIQMLDPGFVKGVYKMRISFSSLGKSYFKEAIINFK